MSDEQAQALEPSTGSDDARVAELARLAGQMREDPHKPGCPQANFQTGGLCTCAIFGFPPDEPPGYDTRKLPDPRYCRQCGQLLRETATAMPQGFSSVTGEPLPDRAHVTRTCSSPSGSMHVTWVLTDDRSGWVRI